METVATQDLLTLVKKPVVWVAAILLIIGFSLWIMQLNSGVASYSEQYAWGVYLAGFFAAVSAGAGAMLAAAVLSLRGGRPGLLYLAGLGAFVSAGFIILADLGDPFAIFSLVFTSNFGAPMVLDFWLLALSALFCLAGAFSALGQNRAFVWCGVLLALILLGVESWLLALSTVQHLWSVSMAAAPAIMQALIAGLALVLILQTENSASLKWLFCGLLLVFLAANLIDVIAGRGVNGSLGSQWQALSGCGAFWLGLIAGVAAPVALLVLNMPPVFAGALALFGIFCTKLAYLLSGAAAPALDVFPETAAHVSYAELLVVLGFAALGVLVYQLLKKGAVRHA